MTIQMDVQSSLTSRQRHVVKILMLALVIATVRTLDSSAQPAARDNVAQAASAPRLIVFLTIDQMRADYLERFASQYQGGFARLNRSGAVFTNGYQDHANTETAPGHATTLSGREPYRTGIVL